jgi:hypothetical protein
MPNMPNMPHVVKRVSPEVVEGYFGEYGWSFETLGPGLWRTGFRGDNSFFTIFMRLTEGWLYMTISPLVPPAQAEPCRVQVIEAMLRYNRVMNLAKFLLDEDEDVCLAVELPMNAISYDVFAEGLTALAAYADETYPDLLALSRETQPHSALGRRNKVIEA